MVSVYNIILKFNIHKVKTMVIFTPSIKYVIIYTKESNIDKFSSIFICTRVKTLTRFYRKKLARR